MTRPLYLVALALAAANPAHAGDTEITPYGLLKVWGTLYDQDESQVADPAGYGDPQDNPGVKLRRARVGTYGRHRWLDWGVTVGMSSPPDIWFTRDASIGLVDGYAAATLGAGPGDVRISLGAQKVPVSREVLMQLSELLFQERTVQANHITPYREAGLVVDYALDMGLRFRLGAFNGNDSILGDDNLGMQTVARVEFAHGDTYTTFKHTRQDAYGVAASALYDVDLASRTLRLAGDGLVRVGPVSVMVEGTWSQITPTDTTITNPSVPVVTNRWGGFVQLSVYQGLPVGGLEYGVRGEVFDDSVALRDNGDVSLVFGGVTWRDPLPGLDVGVGYVHRAELAGRTIKNDTLRLWVQVLYPTRDRAAGVPSDWTQTFAGTWVSRDDDGGITLWRDDDGIAGELRPGDDATPLPLVESFYDPTVRVLTARADTADGPVWLELQPQPGGGLCGWRYEDGRRQDAIRAGEGGDYVCWRRGRKVQAASELAVR